MKITNLSVSERKRLKDFKVGECYVNVNQLYMVVKHSNAASASVMQIGGNGDVITMHNKAFRQPIEIVNVEYKDASS